MNYDFKSAEGIDENQLVDIQNASFMIVDFSSSSTDLGDMWRHTKSIRHLAVRAWHPPAFQLETHIPLDQMMSHHPRTVLMIWPSCIQEHSGTILKKAQVSTTHSPKLPGLPFIELGAYGTDVASAKDDHSISEFSAQIHQNPHVMPCCERNI